MVTASQLATSNNKSRSAFVIAQFLFPFPHPQIEVGARPPPLRRASAARWRRPARWRLVGVGWGRYAHEVDAEHDCPHPLKPEPPNPPKGRVRLRSGKIVVANYFLGGRGGGLGG